MFLTRLSLFIPNLELRSSRMNFPSIPENFSMRMRRIRLHLNRCQQYSTLNEGNLKFQTRIRKLLHEVHNRLTLIRNSKLRITKLMFCIKMEFYNRTKKRKFNMNQTPKFKVDTNIQNIEDSIVEILLISPTLISLCLDSLLKGTNNNKIRNLQRSKYILFDLRNNQTLIDQKSAQNPLLKYLRTTQTQLMIIKVL